MLSPLSTSPCSYRQSPVAKNKDFGGEKTANVIGDVMVDSVRSDNEESAPSHESFRKLDNENTKPIDTDFGNQDTVKESVIDKSLDLHIPTSTSFTQDHPLKESGKDPQPPQPRVLTPTPGSGEQKVTKDEPAGANTSESQNMRKVNNATSKSIEHSDNDQSLDSAA